MAPGSNPRNTIHVLFQYLVDSRYYVSLRIKKFKNKQRKCGLAQNVLKIVKFRIIAKLGNEKNSHNLT